ncbi:MAG: hypothetical protein ACKO3N_19335 [Verrucomicrobiota bacterium]
MTYGFSGGEFLAAGMLPGDQSAPALALGSQGGVLVWQDNATDGNGLGISARRVTVDGSPLGSAFRVNVQAEGDQESPQVALLADGSALIVWQSGASGKQSIRGRLLGREGALAPAEILFSEGMADARQASVAALRNGGAAVAWSAAGVDGDMLGVFAALVTPAGEVSPTVIRVNQFTAFNQRDAHLTSLADGSLAIGWVSEQQTGELRADVYARLFDGAGNPRGAEFRVNSSTNACAAPRLASAPDGSLWVAWSEYAGADASLRWDATLRRLGSAGRPLAAPVRLNATRKGDQLFPRISFARENALVIWSSEAVDGFGLGVAGQILALDGAALGAELVLNSTKRGNQIEPAVASPDGQSWMVAWSSWSGLRGGMDLVGQQIAPVGGALERLAQVYTDAISSWQVTASWPAPAGVPVLRYEVRFDSGEALAVANNYWSSPDVLPGTEHSVQVRYVHQDGRVAPWSDTFRVSSWGKDNNGDGLPDDWQARHFGPATAAWPSPSADTDGDGVDNRREFLAGTIPTNPADALKVDLQRGDQGVRIRWNPKAGAIYQVQFSADLEAWTNVGEPRFAAQPADEVLVNDLPANGYYRIKRTR